MSWGFILLTIHMAHTRIMTILCDVFLMFVRHASGSLSNLVMQTLGIGRWRPQPTQLSSHPQSYSMDISRRDVRQLPPVSKHDGYLFRLRPYHRLERG